MQSSFRVIFHCKFFHSHSFKSSEFLFAFFMFIATPLGGVPFCFFLLFNFYSTSDGSESGKLICKIYITFVFVLLAWREFSFDKFYSHTLLSIDIQESVLGIYNPLLCSAKENHCINKILLLIRPCICLLCFTVRDSCMSQIVSDENFHPFTTGSRENKKQNMSFLSLLTAVLSTCKD